ncbi:MAG: hypothetical protein VKL42_00175 [Snowella sp.]|nr:hypothetical protein [Snowella sp.]
MDNASEDASEPSLRRTSEMWLIHWQSQKGINQGVERISIDSTALPENSVESIILKWTNQRLCGTK